MTPYYFAGLKFLVVLPVRISLRLHFFQGPVDHAFYNLTTVLKLIWVKEFFAIKISIFQAIVNLMEQASYCPLKI